MNGPTETESYSYAQRQPHSFVQKRSGNKFADGYNIVGGDNFGEEITMNGPAETEGYSFAQRQHRNKFADGEDIVGGDALGDTITMNGPTGTE
jgi:hypothetical protein